LARISNATDIDPNGKLISLAALGYPNWVLITWYRDVTYGNDEYGCTSLPSIFHVWLVDLMQLNGQTPPNVPHVNLLGQECVDHWAWGSIVMFVRQGRKYIALGGGKYTGASRIIARLVIVDVTDIQNPQVVKTLEDDADRGFSNDVLYCPDSDRFFTQTSDWALRTGTWDEVINASTMKDLAVVKTYSGGVYTKLIDRKTALVGVKGSWDVLDMVNAQVVQTLAIDAWTVIRTSTGVFALIEDDNRNITAIEKYDPSTFELVDTFTLPSPIAPPNPPWGRGIFGVKDYIYILQESTFYIVDMANKTVNSISLPSALCSALSEVPYDGKLIVTEEGDSASQSNGWIALLEFDDYVYAKYDPTTRKITIVDKAGNAIANHTVNIAQIIRGVTSYVGQDVIGSRTSDSNGQIDISDLVGMLRIEP